MLFQPTNIIPDVLNGFGNGAMNLDDEPIVISWQVNGNSPMVAYQICIYQNNVASTLKHDTGKITLASPFYGTNYMGETVRFEHEDLGISLTANEEYKMVITQWWGNTDAESVRQASASVFTAYQKPSLSIVAPSTLTQNKYTFSASISFANTEINFFRWRLWTYADYDMYRNPFYDTGNIYGCREIKTDYDGFFNGQKYVVTCDVELRNGVMISAMKVFEVSFTEQELPIVLTASKVCGEKKSAIHLEWNGFNYITGTPTGNYSITSDYKLKLENDADVKWDSDAGSAMSIDTPWSIIGKVKLYGQNGQILVARFGNTFIRLSYISSTRTISCSLGSSTLFSKAGFGTKYYILYCITPTKAYFTTLEDSGGLNPTTTLYPSETLYPSADTVTSIVNYEASYTLLQDAITSIEIYGKQDNAFVEVITGDISTIKTANGQTVLEQVINGTFSGEGVDGANFCTNYRNGLDAGSLTVGGETLTGWNLYRKEKSETTYVPLASMGLSGSELYDYSAQSNKEYTYYVYPVGSSKFISGGAASNVVKPCFWKYAIIEATYNDELKAYFANSELLFAGNVKTSGWKNNSNANVMSNFTSYPTVQLDTQNYMSGTLTALIGDIEVMGKYSDTIARRNKIESLSNTKKILFLKTRKGDLFKIAITDISFEVEDDSAGQETTASISWVALANAKSTPIVYASEYTDIRLTGDMDEEIIEEEYEELNPLIPLGVSASGNGSGTSGVGTSSIKPSMEADNTFINLFS